MRVAHNIRLTSLHKSRKEREDLKEALKGLLGKAVFEDEELAEPGYDTLYTAKLWIDRQQPLRTLLNAILEGLSKEDVAQLRQELPQRIDERGRLWFRLQKTALIDGKYVLKERGEDTVQARLNLAAHPNTKDNALEIARNMLDTRQV